MAVRILIEGRTYDVPDGLELLRCYQYLGFEIDAERFCWNGNCRNCATRVAPKGEPARVALCCQTPARSGLRVSKLPAGIRAQRSV